MPDGSTFNRQVGLAPMQDRPATPEPVALGFVTFDEWSALQRHFKAMKGRKQTTGAADFAALRARAILHTWAGSAFTMPCYPDSVRFWQLVAFFEEKWVERRRDRQRLPHEKAAAVVLQRGHELSDAMSAYYKISRFRRALASKCRDTRTVEMIDACPREARRQLVLDARVRWRPALRAFLDAVDNYRLQRTVHETKEDISPGCSTYGTHMIRTPDSSMEPCYRQGEWLGVVRCSRPEKGRDVAFIDDDGNIALGRVMGWSAASWRIGKLHGESQYAVRRLSRKQWQPAWRVRFRCCSEDGNAYYEAVALGLIERAKTIRLAISGNCDMPPPLTTVRAIPRVVKMSP